MLINDALKTCDYTT